MVHVIWKCLAAKGGLRSEAEQSAAAHALLADVLAEQGISDAKIERTTAGRPYLSGRNGVDFNLTHTKGLVACAIALGESEECRVGVDAETIEGRFASSRLTALVQRFFAPLERAAFQKATDPQRAFAALFTRKEAYAKYSGEGLSQHLQKTDTMAPDFCVSRGVRFVSREVEGHLLTLCTDLSVETVIWTENGMS